MLQSSRSGTDKRDTEHSNLRMRSRSSAYAKLRRLIVKYCLQSAVLCTMSVISAAIYIWVTPPRYTAVASVQIERNNLESLEQQSAPIDAAAVSAYVDGQAEIIRSDHVTIGAVETLDLRRIRSLQRKRSKVGDLGGFISR